MVGEILGMMMICIRMFGVNVEMMELSQLKLAKRDYEKWDENQA